MLGLALSMLLRGSPFLFKEILLIAWFSKKLTIKVDTIIAHFGTNGVLMAALLETGNITTKKLLTIFHGFEISRFDNLKLWGSNFKNINHVAGSMLPISELWKNKLVLLGAAENRIKVLHMGVDVKKFSYNVRASFKPLRILTVARATEKKGLVYAVDAVLECNTEVAYRIIGDGVLLESLKERVSKHNNRNRIEFLGAQPHLQVQEALRAANVFLLPSITDTEGDMEGIPVSLMEAMASGALVISTYHSGIPELITNRNSGFLVSERNSSELTVLIDSLPEYETLRMITQNARIVVEERFNNEILIDELARMV
jgi:colanic acid/amylovoran biosynthesis glycosyltransferase